MRVTFNFVRDRRKTACPSPASILAHMRFFWRPHELGLPALPLSLPCMRNRKNTASSSPCVYFWPARVFLGSHAHSSGCRPVLSPASATAGRLRGPPPPNRTTAPLADPAQPRPPPLRHVGWQPHIQR
eukprot:scaffold24839_cov64-Isochrysis_galbana.AAC.1